MDPQELAAEYESWKSNAPQLYQKVHEVALEWPSLTLQWHPTQSKETERLVLGSYTSNKEPECVLVIDASKGKTEQQATEKRLKHKGEPNRARVCPQSPNILATINLQGKVCIYDLEKDEPTIILEDHTQNGYGLAWDPNSPMRLASGAEDGQVFVYQIGETATIEHRIQCDSAVNDVVWFDQNTLGAACEDGKALVYNLLEPAKPVVLELDKAANTLAVSPFAGHLVAVAGEAATVAVFDTRYPQRPVHVMYGHEDVVNMVRWSPHVDGVLASASRDRRVILWDIRRVGCEQGSHDTEDGNPEMIFVHGGHTGAVFDVDWHPLHEWVLASSGEEGIAQVWEPKLSALDMEEREVPGSVL